MVYRCACGFCINVNLMFHFFFTFELSYFWGLNTIKVRYCGYLVCATPSTDQFETLQALFSWSVDVHLILALLSI